MEFINNQLKLVKSMSYLLPRILSITGKTTYKAHSNAFTNNLYYVDYQKLYAEMMSKGIPFMKSDQIETADILEIQSTIPMYKDISSLIQTKDSEDTVSTQACSSKTSLHKFLKRNHIDNRIKGVQYQANNPCEDTMVCQQLKSIDAYTVSIFDGHGGDGLSVFGKNKICGFIDEYITKQLETQNPQEIGSIIEGAIKWSYNQLEEQFLEIYEQQIKLGNKKMRNVGTCAITVIFHNNKVYLGNAGDSQAIFMTRDSEKSNFSHTSGNQRLSVNNKSQRERYLKQFPNEQDIISKESQNCYYLKGRLQPTRTIGDYYLKKAKYFNNRHGKFNGPYLSCQPDITTYTLSKEHQYMVIASDGLWDALSQQEVVSSLTVEKQIDLNKTYYDLDKVEELPFVNGLLNDTLQKCAQVNQKTVKQLKKMEAGRRRNYHDDISIAVVDLGGQLQ